MTMHLTEKRMKTFFGVLLAVFLLAEIPFTKAWLDEQGGFGQINEHFFQSLLHDPLYQVTAIDFTVTALLVFVWMVWDSRRRLHPWRVWLWFPAFMVSPSLGTLGYLLTRNEKLPASSES
jgi:hypothetical protein